MTNLQKQYFKIYLSPSTVHNKRAGVLSELCSTEEKKTVRFQMPILELL